jgi:hypothetical protein
MICNGLSPEFGLLWQGPPLIALRAALAGQVSGLRRRMALAPEDVAGLGHTRYLYLSQNAFVISQRFAIPRNQSRKKATVCLKTLDWCVGCSRLLGIVCSLNFRQPLV